MEQLITSAIREARRLRPSRKGRVTFPTVTAAIDHLQQLGIMCEITGKRRHRLFAYHAYLDILNEGIDLLR